MQKRKLVVNRYRTVWRFKGHANSRARISGEKCRKRRGAKYPRGDTQTCGELFFGPVSVKLTVKKLSKCKKILLRNLIFWTWNKIISISQELHYIWQFLVMHCSSWKGRVWKTKSELALKFMTFKFLSRSRLGRGVNYSSSLSLR